MQVAIRNSLPGHVLLGKPQTPTCTPQILSESTEIGAEIHARKMREDAFRIEPTELACILGVALEARDKWVGNNSGRGRMTMQQPTPNYGGPPQGGNGPQQGYGGALPTPPNKTNVKVVTLIAGGVIVLVALVFLIGSLAHRQQEKCDVAMQDVAVKVAAGNATATRTAIEAARGTCKSLHAAELASLDVTLQKQLQKEENETKTLAARPALLAAGHTPEQLSRATVLPVCKSKDRMPVEMIAREVSGNPHYWDCDTQVLYQDAPNTPASCEARKLEFTTIQDENGNSVGACKKGEESIAEDQLRKACKLGASAKIHVADSSEVKMRCQRAMEKGLKAPKTAEFPGMLDVDGKPASVDGCTTVYSSYVDAQNAFGAKLRTKYVCTYDPRTGLATAKAQ